MADMIQQAHSTSGVIWNGSAITFVNKHGTYQKIDADINTFVPSGTTNDRMLGRFDEHYGGGAS